MLIYREKDNLIHKLHPFTTLVFISIVLLLSLIFSHPVYLLVLFLATGAVIIAAGNFKEWKVYLKFSLMMIGVLILINALFAGVGETVLFTGPQVPVLGNIKITLEALAFGAGMSMRLLAIISIFCLYTYAVHPDKVLQLFSRWGSKSAIIITISTRLLPLMAADYLRITEVQRCRGVKLDTGSWWQRAKNLLPVVSVLLLSSLERSLQMAESMQARGYGSGIRTYYTRDLWRPRDSLILAASLTAFIIGVWASLQGWSDYSFYPCLPAISMLEIKRASIVLLTLIMPAILNWGWMKCPSLRSRI